MNKDQWTAKIEEAIADLMEQKSELSATIVADHLLMPSMKGIDVYEWVKKLAADVLAKKFDPLCQNLTDEELLAHADALEAWDRQRRRTN